MIHHRPRVILYVDDTVEQRYAMRRILETEGFSVIEAGAGKEALAQMGNNLALAVVDVKLPDINGYDLSRRMKALQPHLPILQVSASFGDPHLRASGLSGGADAYIAQPVYPSELIALIRRMLRSSEAEESLRFLAGIGPTITSSLSVEETMASIRSAIVPTFADRCHLYLRGNTVVHSSFQADGREDDGQHRDLMIAYANARNAIMLDSRRLIAPLSANDPGFGSLALELNDDREYTSTDLVLATDLSNRAGLALQNCILFASEQSTRSALIRSEKLATAGRMAAAIAHEINNPLEALTNLLYIIEQSPEANAEIQQNASAALAEITRLAHITRQSLGFYRELRAPTILDLSASVRETVELYQKRLDANRIEIKLDLAETTEISGIKGEIRQVISNLLVNAMEAVAADGTITISTSCRDQNVLFVIQDSGPGVDEEVRAQIFEPFFTTKQGTGTGLGLWITRSIVEKHHGEIVLSNCSEASGTRFEVAFPVSTGGDSSERGQSAGFDTPYPN